MEKRRLAGVLLLPALMLAGCAGVGSSHGTDGSSSAGTGQWGGEPSGSLNIMGFGGEDEVAQARIKAFEQAHPQVKVTHNKGDFDAQQFLTALASGNPPDLVYIDRNLIGTYAAKGALLPLQDCVAGQGIDLAQYRPAALNQATYKGKPYGVPEFYIVSVDLVDAKSLKEVGMGVDDIQTRDWNALETTARRIYQGSGGKIKRIGYDPKLPDSFPLWAQINGAEIVKADGAPNLNDPKAIEALDFALKLVKDQGGWSDFKAFRDSYDIFGEKNPLTVGSITAFPMENWYVNVLRDSRKAGLQLGAAPITDREGKPVSTLGGQAWAVPKGAKNPKAACAWAKTMTATDTWVKAAQARVAKVKQDGTFFTGLFTANKVADQTIKDSYLTAAPDEGFQQAIDTFYATLDTAKALNPSPAGAEIDAAWKSAVARALGGQSTKAALDQAQQEAQAAYSKVSGG